MRSLWCAIVLLLYPAQSMALEFTKCPKISEHFSDIRPVTDERIIGIFADVYRLTKFSGYRFALCTTREFLPGMATSPADPKAFSIMLPRIIGRFSDQTIRGILAHELGHIPFMDMTTSQRLERRIDAIAAQWVGSNAIELALRTMMSNLERLPRWDQELAELSLADRLRIVYFLPPPVPAVARERCVYYLRLCR